MLTQQRDFRLDFEVLLRNLFVFLKNLSRTFACIIGCEWPQVGIQEAANVAQVLARGAATYGTIARINSRYPDSFMIHQLIHQFITIDLRIPTVPTFDCNYKLYLSACDSEYAVQIDAR